MKNQVKAAAAVTELCHLGLPAELFVPALLEALHDVVPSCRNLFDWADESGQLTHYYFEGAIDPTIAQLYFNEFHNRREAEVMAPFSALRHQQPGIQPARALDSPSFFSSALYREIWMPQGLKYRVEAVLRGRRGQLLGSLVLYRGPNERCFNADEESRLLPLLPEIEAALENPQPDPVAAWVPHPADHAVLLVDGRGRPVQASPAALRLLMLADGGLSEQTLARSPLDVGQALLSALLRQSGRTPSRDITWHLPSPFGLFTLHAQRLSAWPGLAASPLLLVNLKRQEPRPVALERALRQLGLTPGQHRVCRELARGSGPAQAAEALGVTPATVIDQVRKIYCSIGVRSLQELRLCIEQRMNPAPSGVVSPGSGGSASPPVQGSPTGPWWAATAHRAR